MAAIYGGWGKDTLTGTADVDVISGSGDDDLLTGGAGEDWLFGDLLSRAGYVANGDFEEIAAEVATRAWILQAPLDEGGLLYRLSPTLPGWTLAAGSEFDLKTHHDPIYFDSGVFSNSLVVLDMEGPGGNLSICQDFTMPTDFDMLIEFAVARPEGTSAATARIQVWWNDALVATITPDEQRTTHVFNVTTTSNGANRLQFIETGAAGDGIGTLLDWVQVYQPYSIPSGFGIDTADYSQETGGGDVTVNISPASVWWADASLESGLAIDSHGDVDRLAGIENVTTGSGNDRIFAGNYVDYFTFEPWNPVRGVFLSGAGDDLIVAGAGGDSIDGGDGFDSVAVDWRDLTAAQAVMLDVNLPVDIGFGSGEDARFLRNVEQLRELITGEGDDLITMSRRHGFAETVITRGGNDTVQLTAAHFDSSGADAINLGTGDDRAIIDFSLATQPIRMSTVTLVEPDDPLNFTATADGWMTVLYLFGANRLSFATGSGNDWLLGTNGADRFEAGAGGDTIQASGGDDWLIGGLDGDLLFGGEGTDTVSYEDDWGAVFVNLRSSSGAGNAAQGDSYSAIENVRGSQFADFLIGDEGVNLLDGGSGDDLLAGGLGADVLVGGAGNDTASYDDNYGAVFVNLSTGAGASNAAQGDSYSGIENVTASVFNDFIIGDGGANRLGGGAGDDVLIGAMGADVLVGGAGSDTASYEENYGAVFVNLSTGSGASNAAQGDAYDGIENVRGSIYNDYLIGDAGANRLEGNAGDDVLIGALGADALVGGAGIDTASYEENLGAVLVNLTTAVGEGNAAQGDTYEGIENVTGSVFNDYLIGGEDANRLDGSGGDDTLVGGLGADVLVGGAGTDTVRYDDNYGAVFVNLSTGSGASNAAQGDSYDGIENVVGSMFADFLIGSTGANRLSGGLGNDILVGAAGADRFVFDTALSAANNKDEIDDFVRGSDKIELSATIFGLSAGALSANAFVSGPAATTAEHRIIYNSADGTLSYDADGSGAGTAVAFAQVTAGLALTATDFVIA